MAKCAEETGTETKNSTKKLQIMKQLFKNNLFNLKKS